MVSRPLASLALVPVALGGCKSLLGIEEGVVNTDRADAQVMDASVDGDVSDADAWAPWWDPTFSARRSITLDTTGIELPIADLPVLVRIPAEIATELRPNGSDLRFVADDHTSVLPFEIEPINGAIVCWVKQSLTTTNQRLWMYYGNATASSQSSGASVFTDYVSVHHFANDVDATGNNHRLDAPGPSSPTSIDAIIGRGYSFDGTDYFIVNDGDGPYDFTTQMSVSVWIRTDAFTEPHQTIVAKGDTSWRLQRNNMSSRVMFSTTNNAEFDDLSSLSSVDTNQWVHLLVTRDNTSKAIYVNGVRESTRSNPPVIGTNAVPVRIGSNAQVSGRNWDGAIDEVRISNMPRSTAWVEAEYLMVASPTFLTFGARETQ